ncbi:MAG: DUF3386 family protein [Acidobacteriota bacterium]
MATLTTVSGATLVTAEILLQEARRRRATFPDNQFHGFTANMIFREGNHTFTGQVRLKTIREITCDLPGASQTSLEWLRGVLAMNIAHRLERSGGMPIPTHYPVFIAEGEENALGVKVVFEGDPLNSSYRIQDGVITEVHRQMHGSRFTITTLDVVVTEDGYNLPEHYVVTYFDPETGRLSGVAQYTERYQRVGGMYLPNFIRIIETNQEGITTVRAIELHELALLPD